MSEVNHNQANRTAYQGIESLDSFSNQKELDRYRKYRINRYVPVIEFIKQFSEDNKKQNVIEVGSGSSALLYSIYESGLLNRGVGVEMSTSRYLFAEAWKMDKNYIAIENINSDFCSFVAEEESADWYIVIDNTFTYLEPENIRYPHALLQQAKTALKRGGLLLLDFINYAKREKGRDYQQWTAFPDSDPYSYGVYSNCIDKDGYNQSTSIYIKRDGTESRKVEFSCVYTRAEIEGLLSTNGFKVEKVFSDFLGNNFEPNESDRMVVLARKF